MANIELVTRTFSQPQGRQIETVVGVRVDGVDMAVPQGSRVAVESEAGDSVQTVTVTVFADSVRYVEED